MKALERVIKFNVNVGQDDDKPFAEIRAWCNATDLKNEDEEERQVRLIEAAARSTKKPWHRADIAESIASLSFVSAVEVTDLSVYPNKTALIYPNWPE